MFAFTMSLRLDKNNPFHNNSMILSRQFLDKKELKASIKYHFDTFFKKESNPEYVNSILKRLLPLLKEDFNKKKLQVYAVDPTMVFTFQKINTKDDVKNFNLASIVDINLINEMKS
jgi:hypothetical protein